MVNLNASAFPVRGCFGSKSCVKGGYLRARVSDLGAIKCYFFGLGERVHLFYIF